MTKFADYEMWKNKKTKEKVVCYTYGDLAREHRNNPNATLCGKRVISSRETMPKASKIYARPNSYFPLHIENVGEVEENDVVIVLENGDIKIIWIEELKENYDKCFDSKDIKISSNGFMRIREEYSINLNNCHGIIIRQDDITFSFGASSLCLTRRETENFSKIKEIIKKYIEE